MLLGGGRGAFLRATLLRAQAPALHDAPSTMLRMVPLPRERGRIKGGRRRRLILPCEAGEGDRRRRWRGRRGVGTFEGSSRDCSQRIFQPAIIEHFIRAKAQRAYPAFRKDGVTSSVAQRLRWKIVVRTVYLDGKTCRRAIEIQNIDANRMLTAKPQSVEPSCAQPFPQDDFGQREIAPQFLRAPECPYARTHLTPPPPAAPLRGLPPPGRANGRLPWRPCGRGRPVRPDR